MQAAKRVGLDDIEWADLKAEDNAGGVGRFANLDNLQKALTFHISYKSRQSMVSGQEACSSTRYSSCTAWQRLSTMVLAASSVMLSAERRSNLCPADAWKCRAARSSTR